MSVASLLHAIYCLAVLDETGTIWSFVAPGPDLSQSMDLPRAAPDLAQGGPDLLVSPDLAPSPPDLYHPTLGFGTATSFAVGKRPLFTAVGESIIAADFNGDKRVDLAISSTSDSNVGVFLTNSKSLFNPQKSLAAGGSPRGIQAGDLNGDKALDMVVANRLDSTAGVFLGKGKGGFGTHKDQKTGSGPYALVVADFDGDGRADVAT